MSEFIQLNAQNISKEHICCAISDKKCADSYQAKKEWLQKEFHNGYVFRRLNERAKVFIEYGPAETAWIPITASNYLNINCFWVSGKYKKNGRKCSRSKVQCLYTKWRMSKYKRNCSVLFQSVSVCGVSRERITRHYC
ncbi:hypothetical protein KORDIASMS9_03807 [Kordia sp. SMS9]|nr:hypothetical protein KORDIASMS9_03807 [Kordia sp. SMS9]